MIQRTELLVHAGAPSSRKDDDRYKAQAEAYLCFHGQRIEVSQNLDRAAEGLGSSGDGGDEHRDETTVVEESLVFVDDTQLAVSGLESQLYTSSLAGGPRAQAQSPAVYQTTQGSLPSSPPRAIDNNDKAVSENDDDTTLSKTDLLAQIRSFGKRKRNDGPEEPNDPSPRPDAVHKSGIGPIAGSRDDHEASSSNPSLSSYLKTPILDRSAKKQRLNGAHNSIQQTPRWQQSHGIQKRRIPAPKDGEEHSDASPEYQVPAATAPAAGARSQNSLAVSEPTSELPTSYSLSDITSESSRARVGISQRSASAPAAGDTAPRPQPAHVDSSTATGSSLSRPAGRQVDATATPQAQQQSKPAPEVIEIADDTPAENVVAKDTIFKPAAAPAPARDEPARRTAATTAAPTATRAPSAKTLQILRSLPPSIHPPDPGTSIERFTTHITPQLASLAINSGMEGRYNPASTSRELRTHERGHWIFDTSTLDLERQVKFWQFLEQAVGTGRMGIGIWCERNCEADGGCGKEGLGMVRVWCWGETVKHVYLLLYVASSSQIRKLGARWVDAEGVEVVKMREWMG